MQFNELGLLPELVQAIQDQGYTQPTPIQQQAIPHALKGRDIMAAAQTGTGKTAGFTLPILQRLAASGKTKSNSTRALILTPTRELAAQVGESVYNYSKHVHLNSTVVFGGVKINPQMMRLRRGADVLVATPGRLLDLYQQNAINFKQVETFVLDEADRMLDMGFLPDIKKIIQLLPKQRQTLLFSATFSDDISKLAKGLLNDPIEISVTPKNTAAKTVSQKMHPVDKARKAELLSHLVRENGWFQVLVFCRTKHGANRLAAHLEKDKIKALAIHGNKSQNARTRALREFKDGQIQVLVATDIAARGLDIDQLPHVVNFDLPNVAEDYVHRIGRTGRAGAEGEAVSLISADEADQLKAIQTLLQKEILREYVDYFEPNHEVPQVGMLAKGKKIKKPKQKKAPDARANPNAPRGKRPNANKGNAGKPGAAKPKRRRRPANKPKPT